MLVTDKQKSIEKLRQEQTQLADAGEKIVAITASREKMADAVDYLNDISRLLMEYSRRKQAVDKAQKQYLFDNDMYTRKQDMYEHMSTLYRNAQAGILAKDLKEGQACPVCGATEHKLLASLPKEAPTDAQLDDAKKDADKARDRANASATDAKVKLASVMEIRNSIIEQAGRKFDDPEDIDVLPERLRRILDTIMRRLRRLTDRSRLNAKGSAEGMSLLQNFLRKKKHLPGCRLSWRSLREIYRRSRQRLSQTENRRQNWPRGSDSGIGVRRKRR